MRGVDHTGLLFRFAKLFYSVENYGNFPDIALALPTLTVCGQCRGAWVGPEWPGPGSNSLSSQAFAYMELISVSQQSKLQLGSY